MPNQILQVDENMLETKLDRLVSEKVEQMLNAMLDAEADEITGAARYERTGERKAYRAGHYERNLTVKAGTMTLRVPKLKGAVFESAVIRPLSASRAERRGGAGRHVPGRRQHASGRRHRPPAVGRAHALPDALRQAQARVRGHRSMAEPSPGGPNGGTVPWRPIRTRTCSWTACGDRRTWGGSVENVSVLVAIGVDDTGHREVVGVAEGMKEDKASRGSSSGA